MHKKRKLLTIAAMLPLLSLTSCKGPIFSYGSSVDLSKEYILYKTTDYVYTCTPYDSESNLISFLDCKASIRYADADEIINAVDNGEDILLLFASSSCATCEEVLPSVLNSISHLRLNIYCIKSNNGENASKINEYIALNGIKKVTTEVMNGGTPSMYLLNKKQLTEVFYGSKGKQTPNVVLNALKEYTSCCGLNYCAKDFFSLDSKVATYTLNKNSEGSTNFFYSEVLPLAKKSKKAIQVLDVTNKNADYLKEFIQWEIGDQSEIDEKDWTADNFDGWFVLAYSENSESQYTRVNLLKHYSKPETKTWLEDYFKE